MKKVAIILMMVLVCLCGEAKTVKKHRSTSKQKWVERTEDDKQFTVNECAYLLASFIAKFTGGEFMENGVDDYGKRIYMVVFKDQVKKEGGKTKTYKFNMDYVVEVVEGISAQNKAYNKVTDWEVTGEGRCCGMEVHGQYVFVIIRDNLVVVNGYSTPAERNSKGIALCATPD